MVERPASPPLSLRLRLQAGNNNDHPGLIDSQYPTDRWNVYAFHFSDGEDSAPQDSTQELRKLIDKGINMFGYGEIHVDEFYRSYTNLLATFKESFPLTEEKVPADEATAATRRNAAKPSRQPESPWCPEATGPSAMPRKRCPWRRSLASLSS